MAAKDTQPLVSVCLPVYNGETLVNEAINSVLEQTFDDLELVISDNASTDRTSSICQDAARRDPRVRYFQNLNNQGLAANFNQAFQLARGVYLTWIGHDDALEAEFLARCVAELEKEATTILCYTNAVYEDLDNDSTEQVDFVNPATSNSPGQRFSAVLVDERCDPICGLIKVEFLNKTRLHRGYADSDRVLLAELALRGRFGHISDYLFSRRYHSLQTTARYTDRWERSLIFDPTKAGKAICPWLRETLDLLIAINRAPIPLMERRKCYKYLYWWCHVHRKFLHEDFSRGLKWASNRLSFRRKSQNAETAD